MKDVPTPEYTPAPDSVTQFITSFEKSCISKISTLCAKRKQCRKARHIFLAVSGALFFLSSLFLGFSINTRKGDSDENKVMSMLSVILSALSIIAVWHERKISEDELSISKDIALFEDAINDAEYILK